MWSEEEMREIQPDQPIRRPGPRGRAASLRHELIARNLVRAEQHPHELTRGHLPSIVYTPSPKAHGNFIEGSYRRIAAHPEWWRRMEKVHSGTRQASRAEGWRELDAATSSDALLMNIFCYPRLLTGRALPALLGIDRGLEPVFGFKPRIPLHRSLTDTTEIDMKLGPLLVEAKLTESGFQTASLRKLERYRDLAEVFDPALLPSVGSVIDSYQLIRGVLATHVHATHVHPDTRFCVLTDSRRPELIARWAEVICAVRSYELRGRLRLLTWQEISRQVPAPLSRFLRTKYGIEPAV